MSTKYLRSNSLITPDVSLYKIQEENQTYKQPEEKAVYKKEGQTIEYHNFAKISESLYVDLGKL